jgi:hypothetical protein
MRQDWPLARMEVDVPSMWLRSKGHIGWYFRTHVYVLFNGAVSMVLGAVQGLPGECIQICEANEYAIVV